MDKIIIRKAKEDELEIIQKLNYQLFLHDEGYDPFLNMSWPFEPVGENYFRDKINEKTGVCFVAEVQGEIVGYLAGGIIKSYPYRKINKMTELDNTLVKDTYRGKGIGQKLFEKFIEWSKEQGVERIKVSTAANNEQAIHFYKKVGFTPYSVELEYEIK